MAVFTSKTIPQTGIAKYLLFFVNLSILVCGIALIAIGAIILSQEDKGIDRFTNFSVGAFAIAVGAIIFLIVFFGCYGSIRHNTCLLKTHAVMLIYLLTVQVVLGALAFVAIKNDDYQLDDAVREVVEKVFETFKDDPSNADKQKVVDDIQKDFKCCGVDNLTYWLPNEPPSSCCKAAESPCYEGYHIEGCASVYKEAIVSNIKIIGGVAIAFAVVEIFGAIAACCIRPR